MNGASVTILLVEDDREFLTLLASMLEDEGYTVITAESGEDALNVAHERQFDLVITDVKLGGIDGLDTLAHLKQGHSELQSLVITGYATEADSVRAISLGVGDYLKKPFTLPDFLRAVNRLVEDIHQERGQERFQASVSKLVLWTLETLADQASSSALAERARQAERIASQRGLGVASSFNVRVAVLIEGLGIDLVRKQVPFLLDVVSEEGIWLVQRLSSGECSETLEEKIATCALQDGAFQSEFGEEVRLGEADETVPPPSNSLNLLALARALEVSGDVENASKVLERMGEKALAGLQSVLLQARLRCTRGRFEDAESLLHQAAGSTLDLSGGSRVRLEGGLLFKEMGKKELAQEWLETAASGFEQLNSSVDMVRAKLALLATAEDRDSFHPELLEQLLSPGNLEAFLGSARWLYPYLLSLSEGPQVGRALQRLTRDLPHTVCSVLSEELPEPHVIRALQLVGQVGIDGYEDLLQEFMLQSTSTVRKLAQNLLVSTAPTQFAPVLRLYSLGTMASWVGDRKVPDKEWAGRKPAYVLTYLAQCAGQLVSQEFLIELFWPDSNRGAKNLNQAIFVLRNLLRAPDWPEEMDYVFRNGKQIGLSPDQPIWFDAGVIRGLLQEGNRLLSERQESKAADLFQQAMELDRGSYLEGNYDEWALTFRESLALELTQSLTHLAEIRLTQGRPEDALSVSQHILEREPLDERAHKALFQSYLDMEQPLEVVRCFERLERKMANELSLDPAMDLVKFFHLAKMKL
ncbi:MAG: response regulator [Candidatus Eremiobacteraeota bacterium]|nr:response regulator [Candidatus Eremiobacteraeota bacterium]